MNKVIYNVIFLLGIMPYVAIAMNAPKMDAPKKGILSRLRPSLKTNSLKRPSLKTKTNSPKSIRARPMTKKQKSLRNQLVLRKDETSIDPTTAFNESVKNGKLKDTIELLLGENELKENNPLAKNLYAVMTNQTSGFFIHPAEMGSLSLKQVCNAANGVATFGKNQEFIDRFDKIMRNNCHMRLMVEGKVSDE
jgi:hypothetical protein